MNSNWRAAIGQKPVLGSGLPGGISHIRFELAKRGWNGEIPKGDADAYAFLMVATGRADASTISGDAPLNVYA